RISSSVKYGRRGLVSSGNRQQTSHAKQIVLGTICSIMGISRNGDIGLHCTSCHYPEAKPTCAWPRPDGNIWSSRCRIVSFHQKRVTIQTVSLPNTLSHYVLRRVQCPLDGFISAH